MSAGLLFPEPAPRGEGRLDRPDGVAIAWSEHGAPAGRPVLLLHGGPGSGRSRTMLRFFDPASWRIVAFDQRGCGASRPHAADDAAALRTITLEAMIADIEALRAALGIARWMLFGLSWGATLALAYAQAHPERVSGVALVGATTTSAAEIDWLYRGIAPLFPEEWERFRAGAPEASDTRLLAAYRARLLDPDPAISAKAAADWHDWEAASILLDPEARPPDRWRDPRYRLARARIIAHVFSNAAWLAPGQLLEGMETLAETPGLMVQGRLDLEAPLATAWALRRRWPAARLEVVPNAGHRPASDAMAAAVTAGVAEMLSRARWS